MRKVLTGYFGPKYLIKCERNSTEPAEMQKSEVTLQLLIEVKIIYYFRGFFFFVV